MPFLIKGIVKPLTSKLTKEDYRVVPDRDNWDYVYLTADLAKLLGSKFYSKRKEIKKFQNGHRHEYSAITPKMLPDILKFQEEWCKRKDCGDSPSLTQENDATIEALKNFDWLGLSGGVVHVEGKVEAFTIGEQLNSQTWVTHFEKASPDFPGLYQFINKELALQLQHKYVFVNREQDLGQEGLRVAKTNYHPHHMVEKGMLLVRG
ncbi:MAG: phosphatidylglycerol lysyltransferase domain-containing protein [Methanobacteriota archaeon]